MDFLELVKSRQSDRKFNFEKPVEVEKISYILEAARLAPSACNAQPWKIIVVDEPGLSRQVGEATASLGMNKFAKDAPVHLIIVEESANFTSILGSKLKGKYFPLIDIGILASHITLAAEQQELGSCIAGWFDENKIKKLLHIPSKKRVLLNVLIGYPINIKRAKSRKTIGNITSRNTYE